MMPRPQKQCLYRNAFITYDYDKDIFHYSHEVAEIFGDHFDKRPLWDILDETGIASAESGKIFRKTLDALIADQSRTVANEELSMRADSDYKKVNTIYSMLV